MAGKTRLPKLALSAEQLSELLQLSQSRTASLREVQRARILCRYHEGETITRIARAMEITRKSVRKWIDKALAMGAEARAWVVHLACSKPKELGYAADCGRGVCWPSMFGAKRCRRDILP
jgi:DNA-binding NarL/FixJ family response regulator